MQLIDFRVVNLLTLSLIPVCVFSPALVLEELKMTVIKVING